MSLFIRQPDHYRKSIWTLPVSINRYQIFCLSIFISICVYMGAGVMGLILGAPIPRILICCILLRVTSGRFGTVVLAHFTVL